MQLLEQLRGLAGNQYWSNEQTAQTMDPSHETIVLCDVIRGAKKVFATCVPNLNSLHNLHLKSTKVEIKIDIETFYRPLFSTLVNSVLTET